MRIQNLKTLQQHFSCSPFLASKSLDSSEQANRKCLAFWYKWIMQFRFGVTAYTSSGCALSRVYLITPHSHCITNTYTHVYCRCVDTAHGNHYTSTAVHPVKTVDLTCTSNCPHLSSNCLMLASRLATSA